MATDVSRRPLAERAARRARARPCRRRASGSSSTSWPSMADVISLGDRGAGLRHAPLDHRGRRRVAARGPDPLHLELRHARAAHARWRRTSSGCTASRTTRQRELLITVGASEARRSRAPGHVRPGRRGHPPRAVVRGLRARDRVRGRHGRARRDALRGRLRARPGRGRGRDHAAHEGAVPRLPLQPDRRRAAGRRPGGARPDRRAPRPARVQRRDLRPPRVRHVPPPRVLGAARACASGRS